VLSKAGYAALYPTQEQAFGTGVLDGRNVVLACPTASGKTLVAAVTILKRVLEGGGKALYLVPLRALASEKYDEFKAFRGIAKRSGEPLRIAVSTGDYDSPATHLADRDVVIATYEKCDSILRHGPRWLGEVCIVVLDEVHLLNSPDRGPVLEMLATWLKAALPRAQVLALSATIENVEELARWLGAAPVYSEWRPVPLREGVYAQGEILYADGSRAQVAAEFGNPQLDLASKVIKEDGQVLFFTESRRAAVSLAKKLASATWLGLGEREKQVLAKRSRAILEAAERTRLSEDLAFCLLRGSAFHHAGLGRAHREAVEELFRKGAVKALAATPTLAAGVNLPARTVVLTSVRRYDHVLGSEEIPVMEWKQMAGRAGRPRYDSVGDALIYAPGEADAEYYMEAYVKAGPEPIVSKLGSGRSLAAPVLATVVAGLARDLDALHRVFSRTFLASQRGYAQLRRKVEASLDYLVEQGAVGWRDGGFAATAVGRRIAELYVEPSTAFWFRDCMALRPRRPTDVSLLHMVCASDDISPKLYTGSRDVMLVDSFMQSHLEELYVGERGGERLILDEVKTLMALNMWIEEETAETIAEALGAQEGDLYRLTETGAWLLYSAAELARLFKHLELIPRLTALEARVRHGVKPELLELVKLRGVGRVRARGLYQSGYRTLHDIRRSTPEELARVPRIGSVLAAKIKVEAGGKVRRSDLAGVKAGGRVQTTLGEFPKEEE